MVEIWHDILIIEIKKLREKTFDLKGRFELKRSELCFVNFGKMAAGASPINQ